MAFGLGKKAAGKAQASKGGKTAPAIMLATDDASRRGLAFGLKWATIATSGGKEEAIKIARTAAATHYIYLGHKAGIGTLPTSKSKDSAPGYKIFAAAALAARQHPGTAISFLNIHEGEFWIAVSENGQPTSTDEYLRGVKDDAALERVRELIDRTGGKATVYSNIDELSLSNVSPFSVEDLLSSPTPDSLVFPVPRGGLSIPKPLLVGVLALLVVLAGQQVMKQFDIRAAQKLAAMNQTVEEDPAQAWARVIAGWESSRAAASGWGLLEARKNVNRFPVKWDDWILNAATCRAGDFNASASPPTRPWSCQATYNRLPTGKFNRDMEPAMPHGWSVSFTPLNSMQVSFAFSQPAQQMKLAELKKPSYFQVEVASRLQHLMPALAGEVAYAFTPLQIPAPKRSDGTAFPATAATEGLTHATVSIKGPLRSIDALIKADIEADWREIAVVYDNQGPKAAVNGSALMAEARGEMYAKN